jgi:hypothetical protein
MPEHDLEKLLGGFAADTLTPEEKQQLYSAALQNQELFNALADEQALRELLADPVVRRRLLQALRKSSSTSPSSPWLDWLRRPAGIAWAGGLTAAVFAVILGTKIYQDSLQQAGRSVATEEARPVAPPAAVPSASRPAPPPINGPEVRTKENVKSPAAFPEKDALAGKMTKRELTATPKPQERDTASVQQREREALQKRAESSTDQFAQSKETAPSSADQTVAVNPAPSSPASAPTRVQTPASITTSGLAASSLSARSLFYGGTLRSDATLMAEEKERSEKPMLESNQRSPHVERKNQQFAAGKINGPGTSIQPLGIRYSLKADGTPRRSHERPAGSTDQPQRITLTIESNRDGYLQVWEQMETSPPHLLFPIDQNGQTPSKLAAHERVKLSLQITLDTLMIRFSHTSSNSPKPLMHDRSSQNQLQEAVASDGVNGTPEQATYVVNQDPSLQEIVIRVPTHQPEE